VTALQASDLEIGHVVLFGNHRSVPCRSKFTTSSKIVDQVFMNVPSGSNPWDKATVSILTWAISEMKTLYLHNEGFVASRSIVRTCRR